MKKKTELYRTDWNGVLLEADRKDRLLHEHPAGMGHHRRRRPRRLHRRHDGGRGRSIMVNKHNSNTEAKDSRPQPPIAKP
jgi:hypothetical protein